MAQYDGSIRIVTKITTKDAEESLASLEWQIKKSAKYMDELRSKMNALKDQKIPTEEYKNLEKDLQEAYSALDLLLKKRDEYKQIGLSNESLTHEIDKAGEKIGELEEKIEKLNADGKAFTLGRDTAEYKSYEKQLQYEEESIVKAGEHYKKLASDEERLSEIKNKSTVVDQKMVDLLEQREQLVKKLSELEGAGVSAGYKEYEETYIALKNVTDAVKAYRAELDKQTESGQAKIAEQAAKAAERQEAAQRRVEEQAEKALQRENARIQKQVEAESKLQAKEEVRIAKIQAEEAEEQRLAQIRESAVVSNQRIIETVERIKQLEQEIADLKRAGATEGYKDYDDRVKELSSLKRKVENYNASLKNTQKSYSRISQVAKKAFSLVHSALSRINKSTKKSSGLLSNFASRFKGLALSLLIFNQISKAFNAMISGIKEGFKNLYNEVDSFKSAVDGIKASSLTLKNSFAAAFRPLVEIAIPYIQKTIDAMASFMDAVGQFTAAITGQKTYTKAVKQTTAAIKDQNKAQNRQLSSLDKLNNLTSSKGGSNASGAGTGTMFEEEVIISPKALDLSQWIKDMWENSDFTEFGTFLGDQLKNGLDNINWGEIKEKGQKVASSFATLINGFVQTEGLPESIGQTIGNAINTGTATVKTFLSETKFMELGESVAAAANSAMETTEWGELAETVSLGINGALDTAIGFLDEFDWEEFADSIEEFLKGIDWKGIFGRLGLLLLEVLRGAFTVTNKLGADMTKALGGFFREIGWDSVAGFFDGLSEKIEKQGELVKLAFQKVIDWAKEKLGIHSPSTVFASIGENIVQGLMNGLSKLKEKVLGIFNSVKNAVKTPINIILGFIESLANGIIDGINFAIRAINRLSFDVPDWVPVIGGESIGFNVSELSNVSIPRLATGTVVPPNREFLAVLGDNKREPEVVSPLSTIEQAVENAMSRFGGLGGKEITIKVPVIIDGRTVTEIVAKYDKEHFDSTGEPLFSF